MLSDRLCFLWLTLVKRNNPKVKQHLNTRSQAGRAQVACTVFSVSLNTAESHWFLSVQCVLAWMSMWVSRGNYVCEGESMSSVCCEPVCHPFLSSVFPPSYFTVFSSLSLFLCCFFIVDLLTFLFCWSPPPKNWHTLEYFLDIITPKSPIHPSLPPSLPGSLSHFTF